MALCRFQANPSLLTVSFSNSADICSWGKPRLLQSSTRNGRVTTAFGQRPQLGKLQSCSLDPRSLEFMFHSDKVRWEDSAP